MNAFRNGMSHGILMGAGVGGMLGMALLGFASLSHSGFAFWYLCAISVISVVLGSPKSGRIR